MAKRSKGTRSERKAGRQRAERAREHGLPERKEELRARAVTPEPGSADGEDPASDAPRAPAAVKSAGIPPIAKIVAGALAILVAGYVLTHFRDQPSTETSPTPETPGASAVTPPESLPEPELQPSALEPPAPRAPEPISSSPPKPRVAAPAVPVPVAPVAPKPAPAVVAPVAPKPAPAVVAPPAAPAPPNPATPAAAPVAPKPAAAPAAPKPAAAPPPADNPY